MDNARTNNCGKVCYLLPDLRARIGSRHATGDRGAVVGHRPLPLPVMRLTIDIIDQASGTMLDQQQSLADLTAAWIMTVADRIMMSRPTCV